jgi:hypothetical protein
MRLTKNQYRVGKAILPSGRVLEKPTTQADRLGVKRTTICDTLKKWEEHLRDDGTYEPTFLKELEGMVSAFEGKHPDLVWSPPEESAEASEAKPAAAPKKKASVESKPESKPASKPESKPAKAKKAKATKPMSSDVSWAQGGTDTFTLMGQEFDLQKARDLIMKKARPVVDVSIADFEGLSGLVSVDAGRVESNIDIDLKHPLILVPGERGRMLIDGWHRVARAGSEGLKTLPAVLLDESEAAAIRQ